MRIFLLSFVPPSEDMNLNCVMIDQRKTYVKPTDTQIRLEFKPAGIPSCNCVASVKSFSNLLFYVLRYSHPYAAGCAQND